MGVTLGLYVAIGLAVGLYADHVLGTAFVFVLIGIALGVIGATAHVIRLLRRFM